MLTIWWSLNWGDATACPYTHLEEYVEGKTDIRKMVLKTFAELTGGLIVFKYVQMYWALEISETHKDRAYEDCKADLQVYLGEYFFENLLRVTKYYVYLPGTNVVWSCSRRYRYMRMSIIIKSIG